MNRIILHPTHLVAMACAGFLLVGMTAAGKDLIKNPNFSGSKKPWVISWQDGEVKSMDIDVVKGEIRIRVPQPTKIPYVRLMQPVKIKEGIDYTLAFESKGDAEDLAATPMLVMVCQYGSPWQSYGLKEKIPLENDWKKYEHTFTARYIDKNNEPVVRFNFGHITGNVFFRGVSLTEVEK